MHCQERHLFLFNDLLLVAKAKSGSNFKLKDKVRISEIWLNESPAVIDEVAEIPKSSDTSFVIGWPTTNYVAVFRLVPTYFRMRRTLRLQVFSSGVHDLFFYCCVYLGCGPSAGDAHSYFSIISLVREGL